MKIADRLLYYKTKRLGGSYFQGPYPSWKEAKENCKGYSDINLLQNIFEKSVEARKKGIYERDSVIFPKPNYNFTLLTLLFSLKKKNISVLDIGGAFGTAYFNNLEYLRLFEKINWYIVEQKPLVDLAKTVDVFQPVQFFDSMEAAFDMDSVDVVLMSSSLQYIELYKEILKKINNSKATYSIIDRIPLLEGIKESMIFKQVVSQSIYDASYPIWMLVQKDLNQLLGNYTLFNFSPSLVDGKMYTNKSAVKFFQLVYKRNKNYWGNDV